MPVSRLRLYDFLTSSGPQALGLCASPSAPVGAALTEIQEGLVTCREAGEHGWYGSYAEMAFNVTQANPYLTMPRGVARLISIAACYYPIQINNQFHEYLAFGSGKWPKLACNSTAEICCDAQREVFRRNTVCLQTDLTTPGYGLRFYIASASDVDKRIFITCKDANGAQQYTVEGGLRRNGIFVTLAAPYADLVYPGTTSPLEISEVTGIQKDATAETVSIYQVNLTTGAQTLLLQMAPGETVAAYPRYYLSQLPNGCCPVAGTTGVVQLTAMVKLDLVPCVADTDYLLIQSLPALIEEAHAWRLRRSDNAGAIQQAEWHHRAAVRYLQGQLVHLEGKESLAVGFYPFGSAHLSNQRIGSLI